MRNLPTQAVLLALCACSPRIFEADAQRQPHDADVLADARPEPVIAAADQRIVVGHDVLTLTAVDDRCVVTRVEGGRSGRLETGLRPPCFWSRWGSGIFQPVGEAKEGDPLAHWVGDGIFAMAVIGDPPPPYPVPSHSGGSPQERCGGAIQYVRVDDESIVLTGRSRGLECVTWNDDMKKISIMSSRDRHGFYAGEPDREAVAKPTAEFDERVTIDGHVLELTVEGDECVVTRTSGGPRSRVSTGLRSPCHWMRDFGGGQGSDGAPGAVSRSRVTGEPFTSIALIGDPEEAPRRHQNELSCAGVTLGLRLDAEGLELGRVWKRDTCTVPGIDEHLLRALTSEKRPR